jgi:hypothetical protein
MNHGFEQQKITVLVDIVLFNYDVCSSICFLLQEHRPDYVFGNCSQWVIFYYCIITQLVFAPNSSHFKSRRIEVQICQHSDVTVHI